MAAECVPHGHAVVVDIWSTTRDQSGIAMGKTQANAIAEGVAGHVELLAADTRKLPFADDSFDAIVSNVAIHNSRECGGRDAAIDQAWRVLRAGGRMLIADIARSGEYADRLESKGAAVTRRNLGWRMWGGGPWMAAYLVDARKPPPA